MFSVFLTNKQTAADFTLPYSTLFCDHVLAGPVTSDRHPPLSPPGFEFFEASAKDNINVKQTFERLVDIICEKMSESLDAGDPAVTGAKQGPQLTEQPAPPHQDCAC